MADTSKPQDDLSIEEILGSIRRIIAEDEDEATPPAAATPATEDVQTPVQDAGNEDEEPLELTQRVDTDVTAQSTSETAIEPLQLADTDDFAMTAEQAAPDDGPDRVILSEHEEAETVQPSRITEEKNAMSTQQDDSLPKDASLLSSNTAIATAAVMAKLARQAAITEDGNSSLTLEAMVREMIRPMLREWLDANLPDLVQKMVERELERLTKRL